MKALAAIPATALVIAAAPIPTPIGTGSRYHPTASNPAVKAARPVGGMTCSKREARRFGVHLEVFAKRLVLLVPAGVGVAPPLEVDGPYVLGGSCSYAARTREPTGVIEVRPGRSPRLGQFFALWGQPLGPTRLAGFHGSASRPVLAFVDGRRWRGDPRNIPLRRHAEIVLEIGGFVQPHSSFLFRKGL